MNDILKNAVSSNQHLKNLIEDYNRHDSDSRRIVCTIQTVLIKDHDIIMAIPNIIKEIENDLQKL